MKQKLYRICTEASDATGDGAIDYMAAEFDGFTVIRTDGYWRGKPEASVILEYIGDATALSKVLMVARTIRRKNSQECVCVQILDAELVQVTE